MQDTIEQTCFLNDIFKEMYGWHAPVDIRTYAESLVTHLRTQKRPRELRLYANMAQLREDIENGRVRGVVHIPDVDNWTDVLTKLVVSKRKKEPLRAALCNGYAYRLH